MSEEDRFEARRRDVLKQLGTATVGVSAVGLMGTAAGDSPDTNDARREHRQAISGYTHLSGALGAVESEGAAVLRGLAKRGYISSPSVAAFNANEVVVGRTLVDTDEVLVTSVVVDGERSAQIRLRSESETATVELYLQPGFDNVFAMVQDHVADERKKLKPSDGPSTEHVEIGHCHTNTYCEETCPYYCGEPGGYGYYYERTYECCYVPNGQECDVTNSDCTGCSCAGCC